MALLEVKNLSVSFGGLKAVSDFSFYVDEKEIVSIIGPNGAGKTTVFNLLTRIYNAFEGSSVVFDNKNLLSMNSRETVCAGMARTFQNIRVFSDMRVIENVLVGEHIRTDYNFFDAMFHLPRYQREEARMTAKAIELLEQVGLRDKMNEYAGNLPYGQQRRLEIARAIATGAKLLLLDEPAAGMNPVESNELMQFIREIRSQGFSILLIEHDMKVVMNISDRIYVLDFGKMIAEGSPKEIAENHDVIVAYLGEEETDDAES